MRRNPIYDREMTASSRSLRLPVILMVFNGILSAVTLFNMYSVVAQAKTSAAIRYSSFMELYEFVTTIEFILLMFIVPAVTASSISGERERQTLDLMLTTQMTPAQIVIGKLMGAISTLLLLILSSAPPVAMVFVFGGITWGDAGALLLCYVTVAFLGGGLGLCFSSIFKRSTLATVVTYAVLIAVVAGTYFINRFTFSLSDMGLERLGPYAAGAAQQTASAGGSFYLFLFNPVITFLAIVNGQAAGGRPMSEIGGYFGMNLDGFVMEHWIPISIALQLIIALALVLTAIRFVAPAGGGRLVKRRLKRQQAESGNV